MKPEDLERLTKLDERELQIIHVVELREIKQRIQWVAQILAFGAGVLLAIIVATPIIEALQ